MNKINKVHMLPTEEGSNIYKASGVLYFCREKHHRIDKSNQHLYFTDDSEIKEGDWCINLKDGHIFQATYTDMNNINSTNPAYDEYNTCKKITATTDPKLLSKKGELMKFDKHGSRHFKGGRELPSDYTIPQIPQDFIKDYCENPVGEVMVEYRCQELQHYKHHLVGNTCTCRKNTLVINEDNQVIISPVEKKMYSKEELDMEMNGLLCDLLISKRNRSLINNPNSNAIASYVIEWIKENLK